MDLYTFMVEKFIITDTRAKHHDSLTLGYAAYVDGDMVALGPFRLGDFNNGEYSPADFVPSPGLARVVINDPTSSVAFNFQLLNAGNVPDDALTARIGATADQP